MTNRWTSERVTDSAYRVPGELPPDPPKPRRPSWWATKWSEYRSGYLREWKDGPIFMIGAHIGVALMAWLVLVLVGLLLKLGVDLYRSWRDPCAEYVGVQEQTHTLDGTPVTVTVQKCLRLKEGRGR